MGYYLLLLFIMSFFIHFVSRFPPLGIIRFDFLLMSILLLLLIIGTNKTITTNKNAITKRLIIFISYFLLTIPLVRWPGSVIHYGIEYYSKVIFFYFFIINFIKTEKQFKIFIIVFICCQIFRGLEPVYLHITEGYWGEIAYSHSGGKMYGLDRLGGAPHDVVSANPYAWVIVNTMPFLYYLGLKGNAFLKSATLLIFPLLFYGMILSGSRTGLIIFLIVILGIAYFSEHRVRNISIVLSMIIFGGGIFLGFLRPDLAQRYLSLVDSTAVGADTAQGRINGIINSFDTFMNFYGVFGHGIGTSREVNGYYHGGAIISHNLYIEILQEVGLVGLILFVLYIKSIISSLIYAKQQLLESNNSFLARTIMALQVWVVMDLVYGMACYGLSNWEWYLFGGMASMCVSLSEESSKKDIKVLNKFE